MKNRRNRQWFMGGLLALLVIIVWWVYLFDPVVLEIEQAEDEYAIQLNKKMKVKEKIRELEKLHAENMIQDNEVENFAELMVSGENLEEINAVVQQKIQNVTGENNISLQKYQVLRSTKWQDYDMGVLEFTVKTDHKGIATLLKFLEDFRQLVRIGRVSINYRKSREDNLNMTFRVETLFVDKD
ncbi:hypothetical protein MTBBW1_2200027 [Desulfamplus magnetovallimortis]|uniref:PilO n=1 Tax=Desulfamplus magnetovallimortis TaxID=1246637 RepID=A0A1W1HD71_9BACT|nr:hypothetical protein [Desulfamplus magnetovallimortis]SLM30373.1 hypothetical protein MTBBW1_2200027 [Desulfamplus magnetovallimortis]